MIVRQPVCLTEYATATGVDLSAEDFAVLSASPALTISGSVTTQGAFDIRAGHHVGLVAGPETEVRIRPKVAVDRVLFLAAYAADQRGWGPTGPAFEPADDLVAGAATAMATLAEQALAQGVLQGYRVMEEALPLVRGRIDAATQARRRFGMPLPVDVRYDDFTADIDENRILRTALRVVERLPLVPPSTVRRARHLGARLEGVAELRRGARVPAISFTRLNRRYEPSLTLGRLILQATSFDLPSGTAPGVQFLLDMNRVFEDFLTVTLGTAIEGRHGGHVVPQRVAPLDIATPPQLYIKPDLTWLGTDDRPLGVIDAKYKSLATAELPNADVYQALAYAQCLRLPDAHLVYAAGNERPATYLLEPGDATVHVHALDLDASPKEILARVDGLAGRIAQARVGRVPAWRRQAG